MKNHKTANNSTISEARDKISTDLKSLELKKIDVCSTKFRNNLILLYKIGHTHFFNNQAINCVKDPHNISSYNIQCFLHIIVLANNGPACLINYGGLCC
jgi:hypothetical protein